MSKPYHHLLEDYESACSQLTVFEELIKQIELQRDTFRRAYLLEKDKNKRMQEYNVELNIPEIMLMDHDQFKKLLDNPPETDQAKIARLTRDLNTQISMYRAYRDSIRNHLENTAATRPYEDAFLVESVADLFVDEQLLHTSQVKLMICRMADDMRTKRNE